MSRLYRTGPSSLPSLTKPCYSTELGHGGLSQWGRSNRPRIRLGSVKSLNAPWELSQLALAWDYAKKIDPCRMLVWLGRHTVLQDLVSTHCYLAGRYKLGRSCSNSNLLRGQSAAYLWKVYLHAYLQKKCKYSVLRSVLLNRVCIFF